MTKESMGWGCVWGGGFLLQGWFRECRSAVD